MTDPDMTSDGIERLEPCDRCPSQATADELATVYTVVNGIEKREYVCEGCEPEARDDEKPRDVDTDT